MVKKYRFYIPLAFIVVVLDQLAKYLIRTWQLATSGHVLDITLVTNVGSLFSLFNGVVVINTVFIIISFLSLGLLIYYIEKEKDFTIGVGLLVGGILGNLLDRLFFGVVIDWINFHFWPIFNIADTGIVLGVTLLVLRVLQKEKGERRKK